METNVNTKSELSSIQISIRALYYKVQEQKTAVYNAEQGRYCTDGYFKYGNNTPAIDIKTIRQSEKIAEMLAFLLDKQRSNKEAAEILGLANPVFTWQGATIEDWTADFKTRVTQINIIDKKNKLALAEAELAKHRASDPEFFASIELEKINSLID